MRHEDSVEFSLNKALSQGFTGNIRRELSSQISQANNPLLEGQTTSGTASCKTSSNAFVSN